MKTKKKDKIYIFRIFRTILGPIYKWYYNPKIIGKENIPKDGSILVVGNHIHIMDQCNVIVSTKRPIHYMAKKEYFDPQYKEGKFGWFFRSAGCIPVDRQIHDDAAKGAALDVLNEGHALGLFPEGTRNGLKEAKAKEVYDKYLDSNEISFEDFYKNAKKIRTSQVNYLEELLEKKVIKKKDIKENINRVDEYLQELVKSKKIKQKDYDEHFLLPFKFGAVSMAKKTDSWIVPFGITGDYKFRSKNLIIRFGKPFKVGNMELEEANEKLFNEVKHLMLINKEVGGSN